MKLFNRFFGKLIFLLILLMTIILLDKYKVFNIEELKGAMYKHINVSNVISVFKGELFDSYFDDDIEVDSNIYIVNRDDGKRLMLETNDVISLDYGQVIKIIKTEDNLYKIYIQSKDNIYVYSGLKNIEVQMYQIVKTNQVIGHSDKYDSSYYCYIEILSNDSIYEK